MYKNKDDSMNDMPDIEEELLERYKNKKKFVTYPEPQTTVSNNNNNKTELCSTGIDEKSGELIYNLCDINTNTNTNINNSQNKINGHFSLYVDEHGNYSYKDGSVITEIKFNENNNKKSDTKKSDTKKSDDNIYKSHQYINALDKIDRLMDKINNKNKQEQELLNNKHIDKLTKKLNNINNTNTNNTNTNNIIEQNNRNQNYLNSIKYAIILLVLIAICVNIYFYFNKNNIQK